MIASRRIASAWALSLALGLLLGCRHAGPIERGPAPAYADAAERFNANLAGLDRLWARATIRARYTDPDGARRTEQGEGHVQCILPDRFALNVGKIGETLAYLGCNAEHYWWFELRDRKEAWVGNAGEPLADGSPIPIRPEDAALLLGVSKLDTARGSSRWSDDGRWLILETPAEHGTLALWLEPTSCRPSRVELRDEGGELRAASEMKGDQELFAPGAPGTPRIYRDLTLLVPGSESEIRISLGEPQATKSRPTEAAFNLERLLEAYGVEVVHDLNQEPAP